MEILIGHSCDTDNGKKRFQSLEEHSRNVAQLCGEACRPIGLEHTGRVGGFLHDSGKAPACVQSYLRGEWTGGKLNHSSAGARWIWESFGRHSRKSSYRLTAQLIAVAIECHHGTRCDLYSPEDGSQPWLDKLYSPQADPLYLESCEQFFSRCIPESEIRAEMELAAKEIQVLYRKLNTLTDTLIPSHEPESGRVCMQFLIGLVQRFLFGALVDADWSDTSRFENGPPPSLQIPSWKDLRIQVEHYLATELSIRHPIDTLRSEISGQCRAAGQDAHPGIYRLYVPTGGGKTFSGLRYAVHAAEQTHAERIFYFAPYRSIIGQNTDHFRAALGRRDLVLEHHSDVVLNDDEHESLLPYTSRWKGVPFIATTMVQFLNTLFAAPRQNVRRFPALANSVLFFDEIQSLPTRLTYLFNLAVNLLAYGMGCTVILCTATQPALDQLAYPLHFSEPKDIVPDYAHRFEQFKRTQIVPLDAPAGLSAADFASFTLKHLPENRSILLIFNTRAVVERVYDLLQAQLGPDVLIFCLTTHLCPQHRSDVIQKIKNALAPGSSPKKLICVSTQLIEAGVDLSFDCVIRSMAGLPSIAQAAGRCNRHGDDVCRPVYIAPCSEERLEHLADLDEGRRATERLLQQLPDGADLLDPSSIQSYYDLFYAESHQKNTMSYPVPPGQTLLDLLSENRPGVTAYTDVHRCSVQDLPKAELRQAFGTAESNFRALDENTIPVVVPYSDKDSDEGEKLVSQLLLSARPSAKQLRDAQHYTVGLYQNEFNCLSQQSDALMISASGSVYLLQKRYYDSVKGILTHPLAPEVLMF